MKHQFINLQLAPDPKQSDSIGSTGAAAPIATMSIAELLAKNIEASAATKSETIEVLVKSISNRRPVVGRNGELLQPVMVTTVDHGNFFPLLSGIKNMPKSFFTPVRARAVLTPRVDPMGVQRLNMSSLEFEGLSTETALAIQEMPAGTALFASPKM